MNAVVALFVGVLTMLGFQPRAYNQNVDRIVRRSTIVTSADDIYKNVTLCLDEDRPCVLEMGANIALNRLTLPGGLRSFSLDGAGRWKLIVTASTDRVVKVEGAEGGNGFPADFQNLEVVLKPGVVVDALFVLEQYYTGAAAGAVNLTSVRNVEIDATESGASLVSVFRHGDYTGGLDRFATVDVDTLSLKGSVGAVFSSVDSDVVWQSCQVSRLFVDTLPTVVNFVTGNPSFDGSLSLARGALAVNITDGTRLSIEDSSLVSITNSTTFGDGVVTLQRVSGTRSLGVADVDLDAIKTILPPSSVTLNTAGPTITPGAASYLRVTHGAGASGNVTISTTNVADGSALVLRFVTVAGTATYTDGAGNLQLASTFTPTALDTLSLVYDDAASLWFETARSVN